MLILFACAQALPQPSGTGERIFSATCAGCHGLDGKGGEHGPDIVGNERIRQLPDLAVLNILRNGIIAGGMPAFGSSLKPEQLNAVLSYLRSLQGKGAATAVPGDAAAGRRLFFGRAGCSGCHNMVGGKGGFIASDLSGYGAAHQPPEIRERILNPPKSSRALLVKLDIGDGQSFTGMVRNEDNFSIQLQALDGRFIFVEKRDVLRRAEIPGGLMPRNYGSTLSKAQVDDLVSYLANNAARP